MGKIGMSIFSCRKGVVRIAPHVPKPTKSSAKLFFEQLLFLNRLKIRYRFRDISSQSFPVFSTKSNIICKVQCKLQCCVTPPKPVKRAEKRAQKTMNAKYSPPYTNIAERHSMSVLQSIGKNKKEIASILHVSKSTVKRQMKKFKQTGSFMVKEKKGRPSKFTDETSAQLVAWVEEDRRCTSSKLSTMVKDNPDIL
jgi:hypothetical protein